MTSLTTSPPSQLVRNIPESVTLAITAKAKALRALGEDVISLASGEPDFATPAHVVEAAQRACADPAMQRYTPTAGLPALREAIAAKTARDSGFDVEPAQVLVSNGGKHSLHNIFLALLEPGDEVLLPAPYWVSHPEQIALTGATPVPLETASESGYRIDVDRLDAARGPRTRALLFVSPSNPTGTVYSPAEVAAIGQWAAENGIWVVTDEIYEHLVYGDATFSSMPALVPELRDRCVVANGVAKTYAMTGWRVGWSIAPLEMAQAMIRLQSHTTSNVANVAQAAAVAALNGPFDEVEAMRAAYDRRRRITHARLNAIDGVTCPMPEGAFYAFASCTELIGRDIAGTRVTSSMQLCELLLEAARVAFVPGEAFGAPGHVRVSYAINDDDLERGLDRVAKVLAS